MDPQFCRGAAGIGTGQDCHAGVEVIIGGHGKVGKTWPVRCG